MKDCWHDGDLRAYLDGELSPPDRERVAAHLAVCHECEARYDEVAGRAGLVTGLLDSLSEMEPAPLALRPRPVRSRWRQWTGAAAGMAAGIALAALLIPRDSAPPATRRPVDAAVVEPRPATAPEVEVPLVSPAAAGLVAPMSSRREIAGPARVARAPRTRQLPRDVFLALDDEPIETGVVVRMTLGEEQIPADVVFGKDGRARAVRLIGTQTIH